MTCNSAVFWDKSSGGLIFAGQGVTKRNRTADCLFAIVVFKLAVNDVEPLTREFKLEASSWVLERGVSVSQAAREWQRNRRRMRFLEYDASGIADSFFVPAFLIGAHVHAVQLVYSNEQHACSSAP